MEHFDIHIQKCVRFPDFANCGKWEIRKLKEIATRITIKNKNSDPLPVLTNSATGGVINQQDYFEREIVSKDNLNRECRQILRNFITN